MESSLGESSDPHRTNFFSLQVEPSDLCNLRCKMCSYGKGAPPHGRNPLGMMGLELMRKIVKECSEFEFPQKVLDFQWLGEPLLNKEFILLLEELSKWDAENKLHINCLSFVTNGLLFDERVASALSSIKNTFVAIEFSIDAHSPETYSVIKGSQDSDFNILHDNIKRYLLKVKDNPRTIVGLRLIVMKENVNEIESFIDYWGKFLDNNSIGYEVTKQHHAKTNSRVRISLWPLFGSNDPAEANAMFREAAGRYVN